MGNANHIVRGRFSVGQEQRPADTRVGCFADGQRMSPPDPCVGRFSRGQEATGTQVGHEGGFADTRITQGGRAADR